VLLIVTPHGPVAAPFHHWHMASNKQQASGTVVARPYLGLQVGNWCCLSTLHIESSSTKRMLDFHQYVAKLFNNHM
jgi:uncharacterized integral membrane protein